MTQSVDALHLSLWSLFENSRGKHALSDIRDTVFAAVALKAAEERGQYDRTWSARSLVPGGQHAGDPVPSPLRPDQWKGGGWEHLLRLASRSLVKELGQRCRLVEQHEASLNGALSALDRSALKSRGDAVHAIIAALSHVPLDPYSFEVPWALGAAMGELIATFAHSERGRGEYSTSPGVATVLAGLLDLAPGLSIHDPAAGTCTLLVECAKQLAATGEDPGSLRLSGTELNASSWSVGRIHLWSCGLDARAVHRGDVLDDATGEFFDRVVCDPPLGTRMRLASTYAASLELPSEVARSEDAFLARVLSLLRPRGQAVVLVPHSFLFRNDKNTAALRRRMSEERLLKAVVQLPAGMLFGTNIRTSVLVIDRDTHGRREVVFVDASAALSRGESREAAFGALTEIRAAVHGTQAAIPVHTARYEAIAAAAYTLSPDRFFARTVATVGVLLPTRPGVLSEATELILDEQQRAALESIVAALDTTAVVNLVGPHRSGKTILFAMLARRLVGTTVVTLRLDDFVPGKLGHTLRTRFAPSDALTRRLVILVDDWDDVGASIRDSEIPEVQRLLHAVVSRSEGGALVFASLRPLADLQTAWSREVVPSSVLGTSTTVTLGPASRHMQGQWARMLRTLRNRLAHDHSIDLGRAMRELENSPLWAEVAGQEAMKPRQVQDLVTAYVESHEWEQFLDQLAQRHEWLRDECLAQGFDLERQRGQLAGFLLRTNMSADQFVSQLLRPSDVRRLFPDVPYRGEKIWAIRDAFTQWQGAGQHGRFTSVDEDPDTENQAQRTRRL